MSTPSAIPPPIRPEALAPHDLDYDTILRSALAIVEAAASGTWTDHNPSDPGITILEQIAWSVAEQHYRLSRTGRGADGPIRLADRGVWPPPRSDALDMTPVTAEDYAAFAREVEGVERAWAVPALLPGLNWDGRRVVDHSRRPGGVTIVVDIGDVGAPAAAPWVDLGRMLRRVLDRIGDRLDPYAPGRALPGSVADDAAPVVVRRARRRVLGDEVRVAPLRRTDVVVAARLHVRPGLDRTRIAEDARGRVQRYFASGRGGEGWTPGEAIPVSEVVSALAAAPEVVGVTETDLEISGDHTTMRPGSPSDATLPAFTVPRLAERRCLRVEFVIQESSR